MRYICVFCGSSEEGAVKYAEVTKALGKAIVKNGFGLVYGGGNVGLMKILADSVKEAGGNIIGVVTPEVIQLGVAYAGITLVEEATYSARKAKMAALSEGFIALPGGYGTLDEFTEVAINNQFASYKNTKENPVKPLGVLNIDHFYDGLLLQVQRCLNEKFITNKHAEMIYSTDNPEDIVQYIANFKSPIADNSKWWEKSTEQKATTNKSTTLAVAGGMVLMGVFALKFFSHAGENISNPVSSCKPT